MFQLIGRVELYYDSIDAGNTDTALQIFDPKAIYDRGRRRINGELAKFYHNDRDIDDSRHIIKKIAASNGIVAVMGTFVGTNKSGEPLETDFKDVFIFQNDLVIYRVTEFLGQEV